MLVTFFTVGYLFMQVHTKRAFYLSHRANTLHIDEPTLEVFAWLVGILKPLEGLLPGLFMRTSEAE